MTIVPLISSTRHLFFCLFFIFVFSATAQTEPPTQYVIETEDGNIFRGTIVKKDVDIILFQTDKFGQITIHFEDIKQIIKLNPGQATPIKRSTSLGTITSLSTYSQDESYPPKEKDDPYETPIYIGKPTAFGLKKGTGYYQNEYLFLNGFQFGITDFFSLGAGIIPVSADEIPVWVQPKISLPLKKDHIYMGIGSINGTMFNNYSDNFNFGAVYSEIGVGDRANHINVGVGKAYEDGEFTTKLLFSFSGILQVGDNLTLATENFVNDQYKFYTGGIHYRFGSIALQTGLLYFSSRWEEFAIPMLGLVVPFKTSFYKEE